MPSFTFVSSANSVVLRGGVPVFVDISPDTLNISPSAIQGALTSKTRAIMPVHYAGVACEMDKILQVAEAHRLTIIEDAAHGIGATWRGRHLGTIGHFGALSFHETKNIVAGEGGALLVNSAASKERAEVVRDKGTNRKRFIRGEVDRYTWVDVGSSFLPGELQAALLASQLEQLQEINQKRVRIWNRYHEGLSELDSRGLIKRPHVPMECSHNGHIYWIITQDGQVREKLRRYLGDAGVQATSHYECLHKAPIAEKFAKVSPEGLPVTEETTARVLRLPIYPHLDDGKVDQIINLIHDFFRG